MKNAVLEESAASSVKLDGVFASDLAVVNAARVSFNQESDEMTDREVGLINFLMKNRHGSPFEHGYFRFKIKCPIFVAREWFRHRIGSFNEWSGRYSKIEPEFFLPDEFRTQVGKPGAYSFTAWEHEDEEAVREEIIDFYKEANDLYELLLKMGIAKEQARIVLPVATYTHFVWSVNPRALMNFLSLRAHRDAMKEIRDLAYEVEKVFMEIMPVTHAAWEANDRIAP